MRARARICFLKKPMSVVDDRLVGTKHVILPCMLHTAQTECVVGVKREMMGTHGVCIECNVGVHAELISPH